MWACCRAQQRPERFTAHIDNGHCEAALRSHNLMSVSGPVAPFARDLLLEVRASTLIVRKDSRETNGMRIADKAAREARVASRADFRTVVVHPRGPHIFWLIDRRTSRVYPDARLG
eukprot:gene13337-37959_t